MEAPAPAMDFARNDAGSGAMPPAEQALEESAISATDKSLSGTGSTGTVERIILKNADLSIVVPDPAASLGRIVLMAERMGGFVVNSNLYKTTTSTGIEVPYAYLTIRVPAELLTSSARRDQGAGGEPR